MAGLIPTVANSSQFKFARAARRVDTKEARMHIEYVQIRRRLILGAVAFTVTRSAAVLAQAQGKVWRMGFLSARSAPTPVEAKSGTFAAFLEGLREHGYIEGKNLIIDWRFADGNYARLDEFAAEFVKNKVDVILAATSQPVRAAQKATTTIPIVIGNTGDPVGSGFVKSLGRPGGNITGISNFQGELGPKQLEMLRSIAPKSQRIAVLLNPTSTTASIFWQQVEAAAKTVKVTVAPFEARTREEIPVAFAAIAKAQMTAVIVSSETILFEQHRQIAALALKLKMPSIYSHEEAVEVGGLLSYGPRVRDSFRRAAYYVDRILKGTKPADLPVEQPTRFYLAINKTIANSLGLKIPTDLAIRVERYID